MIWIKQKLKRFWKWIVGALAIPVALAAPIIPKDQTWLVSYETIAFETADGDLGMNEWADAGNGEFYIREVLKNEGQFTSTTSMDVLFGKKEVRIRAQKSADNPNCEGCAYYSEFLTRSGKKVRVSYEGRYNDLKEVWNAPQPKRTERISVLLGNDVEAAIAFDATTNSLEQSAVTSYSWSHTTAVGSNRVIVVGHTGDDTNNDDCDATLIEYNTVDLTIAVSEEEPTTNNHRAEIWYLKEPTEGSNTVVVTLPAGGCGEAVGGAITLTGVDQSTPLDATQKAFDSSELSGAMQVSITTVADNAYIVVTGLNGASDPANVTPITNTNQRWEIDDTADTHGGGDRSNATTAGAYSVGWSSTNEGWVIVAASFDPAAEAGGG